MDDYRIKILNDTEIQDVHNVLSNRRLGRIDINKLMTILTLHGYVIARNMSYPDYIPNLRLSMTTVDLFPEEAED